MIIRDKQKLQCKVIDFSVPLDNNVPMKETEKINSYIPMISELQQMYRKYKYEIIRIVIGTLGAVSTSLKGHLESSGILWQGSRLLSIENSNFPYFIVSFTFQHEIPY